MKIKEILEIVKGRPLKLRDADKEIKRFIIDSRKAQKDSFFVPLKGSKADGHDFIDDALKKGSSGYLTSIETDYKNGILVDDTLKALTEIGIFKRKKLKKAVGITGTSGKTTTKEILRFLLSDIFRVYATEGNYNNEIGLPLTLSNIPENTEVGVFELGASKRGDISKLVSISKPEVRVLTSVGHGHIEGFGSFEGVVQGKGEIFDGGEISVLPEDLKIYYMDRLKKYVTFGISDYADIKISEINITPEGTAGTVSYKNDKIRITVPVYSRALFNNIAAALSVLYALDINPVRSAEKLRDFSLPEGRGKVLRKGSLTVIDDSYNANPLSVKNAIETLSGIPSFRVLILGDMLELGDLSEQMHIKVGKEILSSDIDLILLYGRETYHTYTVIKDKKNSYHFDDKEKLYRKLMDSIKDKECVLLVKGSRGMRMEDIIEKVLQS
ncbi:MAG TPA: UDP-N-acetylmuramoyl-tripeptide--D-alanyl-D-alanine ligase [Persephonella sp.]|uniref:UDP-N-acetylmuramoyl-tripeptide--D-alanyl-D-alanine ligase n=1 Tax=Persephonella marina (strain DSM 14350 / EX-H1) TaxID=123214 RepID=C0QU93_PERMH|nr:MULTISPECIES: UDP-N-acetylmuramoyl-tripeptide--D-alanyl-D-alanine ligase [Persephonella]ACO04716.1 udp-murnac-pentapeptide sythetase [Persephonella marina EX-H1]HCB70127.1 UDP-N-acetylmuramoyl-tripeptide--D-alanyl-D-alanine ligase [Persephonella sp.]